MLTTKHLLAAVAALTALVLSAGCSTSVPPPLCASGILCPEGTQCAAHTAQCISDLCGNGHVDPGEVCDDGGTLNGDVIPGEKPCSADCKSDELCGNGVRDIGTGEMCDCAVNPLTGLYACDPPSATGCVMDGPNRCMSGGDCGNGVPDGTEQCDQGKDGKPAWGPTCNIDCTMSKCGDGKINPAAVEYCDGGNGTNGQSIDCNDNCTPSVCGDGRINPLDARMPERRGMGEQCDDGMTVGNGWNLACLPTCLINVCGDGHRNTSSKGYEACDDGPASAIQRTDCPYSANATSCILCSHCQTVSGIPHYCGDGTTDAGYEQCDAGSRNGLKTCPANEPNCTLCSTTCTRL